MKKCILFYLNGKPKEISGADVFLTLSDYLRRREFLSGTKVVCSEGDCGACSVLMAKSQKTLEGIQFKSVNSCILTIGLLDGYHVVTVEGLSQNNVLNPVQKSMVDHHGAQCGFCTPGIVTTLSALYEEHKKPNAKQIKNALTGNLCRCTGYQPILNAASNVSWDDNFSVSKRYITKKNNDELFLKSQQSLSVETNQMSLFLPSTLEEALELYDSDSDIRLIASGTDLGVLFNKGRLKLQKVLSLRKVPELNQLKFEDDELLVGANISLDELQKFYKKYAPVKSDLLNIFASPQIKNAATLVGNVANGSPIGDTLPLLLILDARLSLSHRSGKRELALKGFYKGYKNFDIKPNEIITSVKIPSLPDEGDVRLYKVSQRRDLDISTVTAAFYLNRNSNDVVTEARICFGGVGPIVERHKELEKFLIGKVWNSSTIRESLSKIEDGISPISDVRGSSEYRHKLAKNLFIKFYSETSSIDKEVK